MNTMDSDEVYCNIEESPETLPRTVQSENRLQEQHQAKNNKTREEEHNYDSTDASELGKDGHQYASVDKKEKKGCFIEYFKHIILKWMCLVFVLLCVAGVSVMIVYKMVSDLEENQQLYMAENKVNHQLLVSEFEKYHQLMKTEIGGSQQSLKTEIGESQQSLKTEIEKTQQLLINFINEETNNNYKNNNISSSSSSSNKNNTNNTNNDEVPRTCADVRSDDPRPVVILSNGFTVVCDTVTDGGGWVVMQRRLSGTVDFYRNWKAYKNGFGDLFDSFWMGLEKTYQLVASGRHELRIEVTYKGNDYFAHYAHFSISGEADNYKLHLSEHSGNASDSLIPHHNNMAFSTWDKDNDKHSRGMNCAEVYHGAWWFNYCLRSNLNGMWGSKTGKGVIWLRMTYDGSATYTEMKFRPFNE